MLLAILVTGEHVLLPLHVLLQPDSKLNLVELLDVLLLPILETGESVLQVLVL